MKSVRPSNSWKPKLRIRRIFNYSKATWRRVITKKTSGSYPAELTVTTVLIATRKRARRAVTQARCHNSHWALPIRWRKKTTSSIQWPTREPSFWSNRRPPSTASNRTCRTGSRRSICSIHGKLEISRSWWAGTWEWQTWRWASLPCHQCCPAWKEALTHARLSLKTQVHTISLSQMNNYRRSQKGTNIFAAASLPSSKFQTRRSRHKTGPLRLSKWATNSRRSQNPSISAKL